MNKVLVKNWNNMIKEDDTVYFLGDMSFGKRSRNPSYWIRKLNGKIIYIRGNHEKTKIGRKYEVLNYNGYRFLLINDPESVDSFDGWVIHGHKHNNDLINYPFINWGKRTINVSVEVINYKPVPLDQIFNICSKKIERRIETIADI